MVVSSSACMGICDLIVLKMLSQLLLICLSLYVVARDVSEQRERKERFCIILKRNYILRYVTSDFVPLLWPSSQPFKALDRNEWPEKQSHCPRLCNGLRAKPELGKRGVSPREDRIVLWLSWSVPRATNRFSINFDCLLASSDFSIEMACLASYCSFLKVLKGSPSPNKQHLASMCPVPLAEQSQAQH